MFVDFFYFMRDHGLNVSLSEWMTLQEALKKGLARESLSQFYHLCRCLCIKHEAEYDLYDRCFASYFEGVEAPENTLDQLMEWLQDPIFPRELTDEEIARLERYDLNTLREMFEERMAEQTERHDGGNRWIGTGGTSPFGHGGTHPEGIRVGGEGRNRSAVQVAGERRYQNLRHDLTLNVRQIGLALRKLRRYSREGRYDELDLEGTIDATARNYGDIDLIFRPERKNNVKLLLLMDVGGSMTPYTMLSERLFSAAHAATHFKQFEAFYFHNCVYEKLYKDMSRLEGEPTERLLQKVDKSWTCILVGDAAMSPYELTASGGSIDYSHYNPRPGIEWLQAIKERVPNSLWLNPEPQRYWEHTYSNRLIQEVFPMFFLSLEGMEQAMDALRAGVHRLQ
jgi:uncharacterized protein with von Willebrand factor type A (vWA) domain